MAFAELEPDTATHYADDEVADGDVRYLPEPLTEPEHAFWRHYRAAKHCSYPTRTGDNRSVTLRSDFYSTREWIRTPMYLDVLRDERIMFELMCPLTTVAGRSRRVLFFRSGSHDFSEEESFALSLLRPHLLNIFERLGVTTRTAAVARAFSA